MKKVICFCGQEFKSYNEYWFHMLSVKYSANHYAVSNKKIAQGNEVLPKSGFDCCVE